MDLQREIAKSLVKKVLNETKNSPEEEFIKLVKAPDGEKAEGLRLHVEVNASNATTPMWVCRIIETAAKSCDISYDKMVTLAGVYHELMKEVSEEYVKVDHEEDTNED